VVAETTGKNAIRRIIDDDHDEVMIKNIIHMGKHNCWNQFSASLD
jgi:hypothetical protein